MYVRNSIKLGPVLRESWRVLAISSAWTFFVVLGHAFLDIKLLTLPTAPVSTIGIAVALYLGFKTTSTYNRWWEARMSWGQVITLSRTWGNNAINLVDIKETTGVSPTARALIRRHLAWVYALSYQLRRVSRLEQAAGPRVFSSFNVAPEALSTNDPALFRAYLTKAELKELEGKANAATQIQSLQGRHLRSLRAKGVLEDNRMVEMMRLSASMYAAQGQCERIKNTPFPWQITLFGRLITWAFILMMPLAYMDNFLDEFRRHEYSKTVGSWYLFVMVPVMALMAWLFHMLEQISESCADPFEGGATDVPITALSRVIEIDLLQMLGETETPPPVTPIDGALY